MKSDLIHATVFLLLDQMNAIQSFSVFKARKAGNSLIVS